MGRRHDRARGRGRHGRVLARRAAEPHDVESGEPRQRLDRRTRTRGLLRRTHGRGREPRPERRREAERAQGNRDRRQMGRRRRLGGGLRRTRLHTVEHAARRPRRGPRKGNSLGDRDRRPIPAGPRDAELETRAARRLPRGRRPHPRLERPANRDIPREPEGCVQEPRARDRNQRLRTPHQDEPAGDQRAGAHLQDPRRGRGLPQPENRAASAEGGRAERLHRTPEDRVQAGAATGDGQGRSENVVRGLPGGKEPRAEHGRAPDAWPSPPAREMAAGEQRRNNVVPTVRRRRTDRHRNARRVRVDHRPTQQYRPSERADPGVGGAGL